MKRKIDKREGSKREIDEKYNRTETLIDIRERDEKYKRGEIHEISVVCL